MIRCFALLCLAVLIFALATESRATVVTFSLTDSGVVGGPQCVYLYPDSVVTVRFYGLECWRFLPLVEAEPGCPTCGDSSSNCTPSWGVINSGDWIYTGSYWEAPLRKWDEWPSGCACVNGGVPISEPPGENQWLDPVQDLSQPRCLSAHPDGWPEAWVLVGPGLRRDQVPVLTFQNGCDANTACNGSHPANPFDYPHVTGPMYCQSGGYFRYYIQEQAPSDDWTWMCVTLDHILPVEFGTFNLTPQDGAVEVEWNTRSETRVDHFELARDGSAIHTVAGTNTATEHHYAWQDGTVENGHTYRYDLSVVNMDGTRQVLASGSATPNANAAAITEYALHQNFPNPFNPTTTIALDLVEQGNVSLKVYNLMGQQVASLVNGRLTAGRQAVTFDASNLSSGVYLYRLSVNNFVAEKKMVLMK